MQKRILERAEKEGIEIPRQWGQEEIDGLIESLTEINNHSLADIIPRRCTETRGCVVCHTLLKKAWSSFLEQNKSLTMKPRKPTQNELEKLKSYLIAAGKIESEYADGLVGAARIAIFNNYTTDCPGYSGKILVVVWSGGPEIIESFIWESGKITQAGTSRW